MESHKGKSLNKWYHGIPRDYFCVSCIIMFTTSLVLVALFVLTTRGYAEGDPYCQFIRTCSGAFPLLDALIHFPYLPIVSIVIPLVGAPLIAYSGKKSERLRDFLVVSTTFLTFIIILAMYPQVLDGGIWNEIPGVFGYGLHFNVDMLSYTMVSTAGILWLMVSIYAHEYMMVEQHRERFYFFKAITFSGVLGTVMAGDILTMFLFF